MLLHFPMLRKSSEGFKLLKKLFTRSEGVKERLMRKREMSQSQSC